MSVEEAKLMLKTVMAEREAHGTFPLSFTG